MIPETVLLLALFEADKDSTKFDHTFFDAAGHRVALQVRTLAL